MYLDLKMNNFDGIDELVVILSVGKKQKSSKDNHNRDVRKNIQNSGGGKILVIACSRSKDRNFSHADQFSIL